MISENNESSVRRDLLSYQPICNEKLQVVGVEMVSRNLQNEQISIYAPPAAQSVSAIINAFIYAGMDELFRKRKVFIKISEEFLMNEVIFLLPKERIVLELSPCATVTEALINRFAELTKAGYALALDAWSADDVRKPLLAYATYAKVRMNNSIEARNATSQLAGSAAYLIASRVDNEQQLELARALNAKLLQGRFYQVPKQMTRKGPTVMMQTVLALITELNSDGSDIRLERFFKENPELNLQLLHMVNSAATGFSITINSIRQAIAILGRTQMIRWLQIMLYTLDKDSHQPSALMQAALWRAKFMETLSVHCSYQSSHMIEDMAFITGVLSLADTLLGESLEVIVRKMNLENEIQEALLKHEGVMGKMLLLAKALESGDFEQAEACAQALEFSTELIMDCQDDAQAWANKISCHQEQ